MIRALPFALLIFATPALADPVRFPVEQSGRITLSPGFTPDGTTIYFAQSEFARIGDGPQRLKMSTRTNGDWSVPVEVPLGGTETARVDYPSVSPDGRTLWLSWSQPQPDWAAADAREDFAIYRMDIAGETPKRVAGLNRLRAGRVATLRFVNNETAPVMTEDGTLYFWTERLDGPGERDIYLARPDGKGGFNEPEPLPAPINTPDRETGWVDASGRLMLLASPARGGEGGADLFVSTREGNVWSEPVALGPQVNGPADDFAGRVTPDGNSLVFTSTRDGGVLNIWTVPVAEVPVLEAAIASLSD